MQTIEGLLLVDKPAGVSSFGVVAKVRGAICAGVGQKVKVGHTGTLDPEATGLLVLAIGKYTKRVPELIKQDKTYEVTMRLGQTSTTGDKEGEITDISGLQPTKDQVVTTLHEFTGDLQQTPPIFSAIKVNGRRAYDLARKGQEVKLQPRPVKIYSNEFTSYDYPFVKFTSKVGSGTYIRSLVEDLGKDLGSGAYMSDLRRTKIGNFDLKYAIELHGLEYPKIANNIVLLDN